MNSFQAVYFRTGQQGLHAIQADQQPRLAAVVQFAEHIIQQQQRRITREDLARLRANYELDLYWPVRFSRWLIGVPSGPITIGGRELFANTPVGCYLPRDRQMVIQDGQQVVVPAGCDDYVYLSEIPELHPAARSSRGILRGDFGLSTVVRAGRPVWNEMMSRLPATLELMMLSVFLSFLLGIPIGIYSAIKQYSRFDYTFTTISFIGSAMPPLTRMAMRSSNNGAT